MDRYSIHLTPVPSRCFLCSLGKHLFKCWLVGDSGFKHLSRRSALHHSALVWPLMVVVVQVGFQIALHLFNRFISGRSAGDAKMLVKQGAMQSLDKTVALGAPHTRCSMMDAFKLEKQLKRMLIRPTAILSIII